MQQKKVMHRRYRNQMGLSSGFSNQRSQQFDGKVKLREKFKSEEPSFNDFAKVDNGKNKVLISKDLQQQAVSITNQKIKGVKNSNPDFMKIIEPEKSYKC
jgi:hypothetical protein